MRPFPARRSIDPETKLLAFKFVIDLTVWTIAAPLAFVLRLDDQTGFYLGTLLAYVSLGLVLKAAVIAGFDLHRQAWRKASVRDLIELSVTIGLLTVVLFGVAIVWQTFRAFPRTVPLIEGAFALVGLGSVRLLARYLNERSGVRSTGGKTQRVLIVGAGEAGTMVAREMQRHPGSALAPVAFLDDDKGRQRRHHLGLAVVGGIDALPRAVKRLGVDEVLIAMPSADGTVVRRVVDLARSVGVRFRILPGVYEILSGGVGLTEIRDLKVEDLLRRDPIEMDTAEVADYLEGRVVLVTGAGGSIGSELVRQIAPFEPERVILLGRGENPLFEFQHELAVTRPELARRVVVGNVCDRAKMQDVFRRFRPDVVFHAAAHKHVPLMQFDPDEAVLNNIGGTRTLAETALAFDVERFVNISTDKAVQPVSMVGATKRIAEYVVQSISHRAGPDQAFVSVRFGNVLGSRGSVVPLFQEQIRNGGPVTLTHPEMTRYLMTIPEASQLVVQAAAMAHNGSVHVLDMGEPVRLIDLANDLIQLSGYRPGQDIEIVFTGVRPGEKLREELFAESERATPTKHEKILVARMPEPRNGELMLLVEELLRAAEIRDDERMFAALTQILPGFEPPVSERVGPVRVALP